MSAGGRTACPVRAACGLQVAHCCAARLRLHAARAAQAGRSRARCGRAGSALPPERRAPVVGSQEAEKLAASQALWRQRSACAPPTVRHDACLHRQHALLGGAGATTVHKKQVLNAQLTTNAAPNRLAPKETRQGAGASKALTRAENQLQDESCSYAQGCYPKAHCSRAIAGCPPHRI